MHATIKFITRMFAVIALAISSITPTAAQGLMTIPNDNYLVEEFVKDIAAFCPKYRTAHQGQNIAESAVAVIAGVAKYGIETDAGLLSLNMMRNSPYNSIKPLVQLSESSLFLISRNYSKNGGMVIKKMSELTADHHVVSADGSSQAAYATLSILTRTKAKHTRAKNMLVAFSMLHNNTADVVAVTTPDPLAIMVIAGSINEVQVPGITRTVEWDNVEEKRVNAFFVPKKLESEHVATSGRYNVLASNLVLYTTNSVYESKEFVGEMFDCFARNVQSIRARTPSNYRMWMTTDVTITPNYIFEK